MQKVLIASSVLAVAGSASAAPLLELQFDINAMTGQADGAFSDTFTGNLHVFSNPTDVDVDGDSHIQDVLIDGATQGTGGAADGDFFFDLSIDFVGGKITGGALLVKVDETGSENSYGASLVAATGASILAVGPNFLISGLTFAGTFTAPAGTFLGVDISPWGSAQPIGGRFDEFAFTPDGSNRDVDTDVDVFIIPLPGAAGLASIGIMGLAVRRRR